MDGPSHLQGLLQCVEHDAGLTASRDRRACLAQNLIGLPKLGYLALQRLQSGGSIRGQAGLAAALSTSAT